MPEWTAKDKRQFGHIESSELKSGSSKTSLLKSVQRTIRLFLHFMMPPLKRRISGRRVLIVHWINWSADIAR